MYYLHSTFKSLGQQLDVSNCYRNIATGCVINFTFFFILMSAFLVLRRRPESDRDETINECMQLFPCRLVFAQKLMCQPVRESR